jgi:hypothetical protein
MQADAARQLTGTNPQTGAASGGRGAADVPAAAP